MSDPFSTTVKGSRHPFSLSLEGVMQQTERNVLGRPSADTSSSVSTSISRLRRKQLRTYKSPPATGTVELCVETAMSARPHMPCVSSISSTVSSDSFDIDVYPRINNKHVYRTTEPLLPLYHPKGSLALSLPELDPAIFGLSSIAVNIDDHDVRVHRASQDAEARRLSSRARRPAAKLREVVAGEEEETHAHDTGNAADSKKAQLADAPGQARSTSPRKRRTAGSGAAGNTGGKKRKKDADDGDGTYPNPVNRRTRNPRGAAAAVASPLGGSVVVPEADPEEGEGEVDGDDSATVAAEPAEAATARSTRSRRSRATVPKRRGSSASETTSTSVSVSIATNTRSTRIVGAKMPPEDDVPVNTESQSPTQRVLAETAHPEPLTLDHANDAIANRNDGHPEDSSALPIATDASMELEGKASGQGIGEPRLTIGPLEHANQSVDGQQASSSPDQSRAIFAKDEVSPVEEDVPEPAAAMDVDTPNEIGQPPANQEEHRLKIDSHPLRPKSPSPHVPPSVSVTASAVASAISSTTIPPPVPIEPTRHHVTTLVPPKRPQDDEKEEGELSDE